jgi:hypothetical protein
MMIASGPRNGAGSSSTIGRMTMLQAIVSLLGRPELLGTIYIVLGFALIFQHH